MAFVNSIPQSLSVFNWAAGALAAASSERSFYHGIFNCQTGRSGSPIRPGRPGLVGI